jgi:hypothetical protein
MARIKLHLAFIALFIFALAFAGNFPARSDSAKTEPSRKVFDASYRSPAATHKVIVQANEPQLRAAILAGGGQIIEDYGAFVLMSAPDESANRISLLSASGSSMRDDLNALLLRAHPFDTTTVSEADYSTSSLGDAEPSDEQLYLVQMVGPIKKAWLDELKTHAEIVSYIPNNAYLVRTNAADYEQIKRLKSADHSFVQWTGAFKPEFKLAPEISLASDEEITATVQMVKGSRTTSEMTEMTAASAAIIVDTPADVLNYTNLRIRVRPSQLAAIARKPNVVWIEPWTTPELHDERQNLIVAGQYSGTQLNPHGYLAWLQSKGITSAPDFIVDFADTGLDQGILDPAVMHRDFLDSAGSSRVVYARYVGPPGIEGTGNDPLGHGTINAAIAGGYNVGTSSAFVDDQGYSYGLGVHPFLKIGASRVFAPDFTNPPFLTLLDLMYRDGARISSNSWGSYSNAYTTDCQTYDSMVRDARLGDAGNQEMTIIFSSGNKGANSHLTSPGSAKNTILVGASENIRPGLDGCGVDSTGADDPSSLISFSSGGPTADGRTRPDIVAPGTHIQGARSQDRGYTAGGVCGPGNYPLGQNLYTWSSGTSHAAPAVAGAAALIRQFFQQSVGHPPSPAMIKAFLTNSTTYMTGSGAGDSLPGSSQGWGLLNLNRALDNAPRIMVDQNQVLGSTGQTFTITGRVVDPSKPFRVTLTWTDAPGSPSASPVVNDLDLQVDIGGKTYLGNHFSGALSVEGGSADHLNNLEAVWTPDGASGTFTIRVVAANLAGDGVPGNSDATDQDFALVIYNATDSTSGGGGGGGPVDSPPSVNLRYPVGGESLTVGGIVRIQWDASDDKSIQSQRIDFSSDGQNFSTIGVVANNARSFDWRIPAIPTPLARVKITVSDGVNLPVSSVSPRAFEVVNGPPDNTPPTVILSAPNSNTVVGGGQMLTIKWKESDNVGVIQRVIELSTDNGDSFQQILSLAAPSSGMDQSYDWLVPITLATDKGRVRITIYDGAGNSASVTSGGKFEMWPLPIIVGAEYNDVDKPNLEVQGRNFRNGETEIYVNGKKLKKVFFDDRFYTGSGMSRKVFSKDPKVKKRVPLHEEILIEVKLPRTGQVAPGFVFKRRRPGE